MELFTDKISQIGLLAVVYDQGGTVYVHKWTGWNVYSYNLSHNIFAVSYTKLFLANAEQKIIYNT